MFIVTVCSETTISELPVIIAQAHKGADTFHTLRHRSIPHGRQLPLISSQPLRTHFTCQENRTCLFNNRHLETFNISPALPSLSHNHSNPVKIGRPVLRVDYSIAYINQTYFLVHFGQGDFIKRWKVAGALKSQKGMTLKRKVPRLVLKVVLSASFGSIFTW